MQFSFTFSLPLVFARLKWAENIYFAVQRLAVNFARLKFSKRTSYSQYVIYVGNLFSAESGMLYKTGFN